MIAEARKINKVNTTFIDTILRHEHKGRIHAEINQIRSDDGGTVTGRFSYSNPNLQQIPAKDPNTGPLIRSLFLPEEGCKWGTFDYSQQEPRLVTEYALRFGLASVNKIADAYDNDPKADFHQTVADMAKMLQEQTGRTPCDTSRRRDTEMPRDGRSRRISRPPLPRPLPPYSRSTGCRRASVTWGWPVVSPIPPWASRV